MSPARSSAKKILIFVAVLILAAFWFLYKFTPVISVEGQKASYSEFLKIRSALEKNTQVLKEKSKEDLNSVAMMNLLEQKLLDILIDNIDHNLKIKAEAMVLEAISKMPGLSLGEASEELYGLSAADFKKLVLLPQAKRDLLENYFKQKNQDIVQAWASLYGTATVKVYYPGYYWDTKEYSIKRK